MVLNNIFDAGTLVAMPLIVPRGGQKHLLRHFSLECCIGLCTQFPEIRILGQLFMDIHARTQRLQFHRKYVHMLPHSSHLWHNRGGKKEEV